MNKGEGKRLCRYCKWLVHTKGKSGFCEATYETKNINSRGDKCDDWSYDQNDTFNYIDGKRGIYDK